MRRSFDDGNLEPEAHQIFGHFDAGITAAHNHDIPGLVVFDKVFDFVN